MAFGDTHNEHTSTEKSIPWWSYVGAVCAFFSALLLWFLQRNRMSTVILFVSIAFLSHNTATAQITFQPHRVGAQKNYAVPFRISWCDAIIPSEIQNRYTQMRNLLLSRGTIILPEALLAGRCEPMQSEIWWTNDPLSLQTQRLAQHIGLGGLFVIEGQKEPPPASLAGLADLSVGSVWETPSRRGMLFRSFYLLQRFDGCTSESSYVLTLRKKTNAQSPLGIWTSTRFLSTAMGTDCFLTDDDYRTRSFVNMMYAFFSTDYKEDQMQLPELLKRVRRLGLEP